MGTKSKGLAVGVAMPIKDRLWAVVDAAGRLVARNAEEPRIYFNRSAASPDRSIGERVVRLRDVVGDVVR